MDVTLLASMLAFAAMIASWIMLPTSQRAKAEETSAAPIASTSKA
jgi:hypothetical protein